MSSVSPNTGDQSPLKILGAGAAGLAETVKALSSVGSAVVEGFQSIPGEIFSQANASQLEKVLRDNPSNRNDPMLSTETMFARGIENQSIVADTGKNSVDQVGAPEGTRMNGDPMTDRAVSQALKLPPVDLRGLMQDNPGQQVVANKISEAKSSSPNISYNA